MFGTEKFLALTIITWLMISAILVTIPVQLVLTQLTPHALLAKLHLSEHLIQVQAPALATITI
jgi:hypothetical protein